MKKRMVLILILPGLPAFAQNSKSLVNSNKNGAAIHGYNPVAFFTEGNPVKGDSDIQRAREGAKYDSASGKDNAAFDQAPATREPQRAASARIASPEAMP